MRTLKNIPILCGRPEGMSFEEYRERLRAQKIILKLYKKTGR